MCSRAVSRLSLKRDFTQEPSLFLSSLSLSLSPCMIIVFSLPAVAVLGLLAQCTTTLSICVTHKYAGVHVLTQTNKDGLQVYVLAGHSLEYF